MSTSDQQGPLTRKQLREIRLTGSTPVISPEEAAAAAAENAETASRPPASPTPAPVELPPGSGALTRRQVRELERQRTASVPVVDGEAAEPVEDAPADHVPAEETPVAESPADEAHDETARDETAHDETAHDETIVSGIPQFSSADDSERPAHDAPNADTAGDDDDLDDAIVLEQVPSETPTDSEPQPQQPSAGASDADADAPVEDAVVDEERPTVNPAFGQGLLEDETEAAAPFRPSFDELLTVDSAGSQHTAPNALIFTPSPGEGSLSGPVASTGEILVTGSYELPRGIGSQGHAHGTTDGKDIDAVLIDGELPPASSPTPIAASSAVSTIKPAGEVIRPPAPEKGNKLMLTLAIVAGGLALALGVALIFAFTTNVF